MVVHHSYPLAEPRVEREAQALIKRGYEVDILCLRLLGESDEELIDSVQVYRLPLQRDKRRGAVGQLVEYLAFFVLAFLKLTGLHLKKQYASVQVHNLPDFLVFTALWPKLTGARVILDIHDVMPEFYAARFKRNINSLVVRPVLWEEKLSAWFADHVIIATHRWRDVLISRGVPADKITVVLNLADERIFKPPDSPKLHRGGENFSIIYHGTITTRYGVDLVIRATHLLRDRIPGIRLLLVGNGEYRETAKKLVQDLELSEYVTFRDTMPLKDLPELISQADIGVTPYRFDGFTDGCLPTKLLEYTALGIPTIATPTPVIKDYFNESLVEFCNPEDPDDLSDHIYLLYSSPERFNELARNTKKFNTVCNWISQAEAYVQLIERLHLAR